MADNRAFISYRRAPGYPWARLIWEDLGERGVDAFLDLESLRSAGWFDDRLLNQIASRPYFLVVLTPGTLERCADPDDWVRREIEHAIERNRIVVPVFIAPFEPSGFPDNLPDHLRDALCRAQGVTVYSQYLSAAIDKLAFELLAPVDLESADLTEDDARFQSEAVREIRALPPPVVPETPEPDATVDFEVPEPAIEPLDPVGTDSPAAPEPSDVVIVEQTPISAPVDLVPSAETIDQHDEAVAQPAELVGVPPVERTVDDASDEPVDDTSSAGRRWLVPIASLVALAFVVVVGLVIAQGVGGDDRADGVLEADRWLRPGDSVDAGDHALVMTTAGQLQLRSNGRVTWAPNYTATATASAILQASDGNFVVYRSDDPDSGALWASGTTAIGPDAELRVVDDLAVGFAVIDDRQGAERWRMPEADVAIDAYALRAQSAIVANPAIEIVQLGAKRPNATVDGVVWDHDRILDEYRQFADEHGGDGDVLLASGDDFNLNSSHRNDRSQTDFADWYFALLVGDFSRASAMEWCETNRKGNCGVKTLSAQPLDKTDAWFSRRE